MSWGSSRYAPCSKTPRSTAVHFSISLLKSSRMRSRSRCWAIARRSSTASRLCRMQLLVELLLLLLLLLQRQRQLQRQPRYRSRLSRYPRLCRWKRRVARPSSATALSVRRSNERRARAIYRHPARGPLAEASSFRRHPARLAVESAHHAAGLVAVAVVLRAAAVELQSHDHRRDSRSFVHRSSSSSNLLKAPCNGRHKRRSKSLQHNNHHPPSLRRLRSRKISRTFRFASISRPSWSTSCCDITVRLLSHATHRLVQCAA